MRKVMALVLLFLCSGVLSAKNLPQNSSSGLSSSRVFIAIEASSQNFNTPITVDVPLLKMLGKLDRLFELNLKNGKNGTVLSVKFLFKDQDSFFDWLEQPETVRVLDKIKAEFSRYNFEISIQKITN